MTDAFVLEAMKLDDVSVSREDDETVTVTCRNHDGRDEIETEDVHDLIEEHDLRVENTVGDFGTGEIRLEVVSRD